MEVINTATCPRSVNTTTKQERFFKTQVCCCLISANGYSTPRKPLYIEVKDRRKSVIAEAKKKKKEDSHSFVAKPDEATGPFPEAVLLKEKKVQEDGRILPEFADDEEEKLFEFLNLQMESDLNLKQMRHYEVVYLIHEDHKEEVATVNSKVEEFIRERKGKIWRFSDWGLRRLAYKIKKAKNAHYILMNFELEVSLINDFKSMLDKDERIIRHLVIKRDEAITESCPPPPEFHTVRSGFDEDDDDDEVEDEDTDYDEEVDVKEDADEGDTVTYINNVEEDDDIIVQGTKDVSASWVSRGRKRIHA